MTKKRNRLLFSVALGTVLCGGAVLFSRCFNPALPACSYICNPPSSGVPQCPDEYECRVDGYCHLRGSTEACPFTMDLMPPPPRADLSTPPDMTTTDDLTAQDL